MLFRKNLLLPLYINVLMLFLLIGNGFPALYNAHGLKLYTTESEHFRIHYQDGTGHLATKIADRFEQLYTIYKNTYGIVLPSKSDIVLQDGDISNGLTFSNLNFIVLWTHNFDFNLRGSNDWFDDVIAHEFAHLVSISTAFKTAPWIPYVQLGYFSHPNQTHQVQTIDVLPMEILPPWFTEGIAQYESSRNNGDKWDTHRDMILRTLTMSGKLLSWDHMQVFAGKDVDMEKTYDHGFSLVSYIAETYGYEKIISLLRESSKITRFDFDQSIKSTLGISSRQLYKEWKQYLKDRYSKQIENLGVQVYGRKINKDGFENYWPRFSPDGKKIYFLSNLKNDYSYKILISYSLSDTIKDSTKLIQPEMNISRFYDINPAAKNICYVNAKSRKSMLPAKRGGIPTYDLYIDTLPPDKKKIRLFHKKTERQITFREEIFGACFSPAGNRLACIKRKVDRFFLTIMDTSGKNIHIDYPDTSYAGRFDFIYSLDWSPDGRHIAMSYFDNKARRLGIYDTLSRSFQVLLKDDAYDFRDPVYSSDGKYLYFSSDRTGIFNIYRFNFDKHSLEQLTNVSGGAFTPDISPDGKKLTYAGYDPQGYGIYLLDSIKTLKTISTDSSICNRTIGEQPQPSIVLTKSRPYSHLPRQFLLIPTLYTEQAVTDDQNEFVGKPATKLGIVFNLLDPFGWTGMGNEIDGYFLLEAGHYFDFIDLKKGVTNPKANFDLGLSGSTRVFPVTLSFDYSLRGIAGTNNYFDEYHGSNVVLPYNMHLQNFDFLISHDFGGGGDLVSNGSGDFSISLLAGMNSYDVGLNLDDIGIYKLWQYNLSKGYQLGAMGAFSAKQPSMLSNISPHGLAAKLQYSYWNQYSLKDENSFNSNSMVQKENYNTYNFLEVIGHMKTGFSAPWYSKTDIHLDIKGSYIKVIKEDIPLPSYYYPVAILPGYTYYYRDTIMQDTSKKINDTVLVTGKAVFNGEFSYRFPLSPKLIDKKLWFIYLERLYGAVNVCGGSGWNNPIDFFNFNRKDWLVSCGLEFRMEAQTFSNYPLAVKLRWDRGLDKSAPLGGNRYSISVGLSFDDWENISRPDYALPGKFSIK